MPSYSLLATTLLISGCAGLALSHSITDLEFIHAEDGILESLQAILLGCAAFCFLLVSSVASRGIQRLEYLGLTLLCFSFVLREVDLETWDLPSLLTQLVVGNGRTVTLLILWLGLFAFVARAFDLTRLSSIRYLVRRQIANGFVAYLSVAALLLVAGGVLDRELFEVRHFQFWEEFLETHAYLLLLLLALRQARLHRRGAALRPAQNPVAVEVASD
jgi:hypothetical protein